MISELSYLIESFPGETNRARCFLHVANLTAKQLMKPFESGRRKRSSEEDEGDKVVQVLGTEAEEAEEERTAVRERDERVEEEDDDVDGFVDELSRMPEDERREAVNAVRPIHMALTKVNIPRIRFPN